MVAPLAAGPTALPSMTQKASSSFITTSSSQVPWNDDAEQEMAAKEREREADLRELLDE